MEKNEPARNYMEILCLLFITNNNFNDCKKIEYKLF